MKGLASALILMLWAHTVSAQSLTILVFDLVNNTVDSFSSVELDTSIHLDKTAYSTGTYDQQLAELEQGVPTQNIPIGSSITYKIRASDKFALTDYPIRTSVKIFNVKNDTFKNKCSGSMISKRHVLSASHCFSEENTSAIFVNKLYVCPVYDNGKPSNALHCSYVSKLYLYKNWALNGEDFTVLELQKPIGEETGWLGIGFNDNDSFYTQDIYHKFSYPVVNDFPFYGDSTAYNGDTIYHSYGKLSNINTTFLGGKGTAQRGESGSSIIRVINTKDYTTYGVLTYTPFSHNRLTNKTFHDIREIIADHITPQDKQENIEHFKLYPNPNNGQITITKHLSAEPYDIEIFNPIGEVIFSRKTHTAFSKLDISSLADGFYLVRIQGKTTNQTFKIIKRKN